MKLVHIVTKLCLPLLAVGQQLQTQAKQVSDDEENDYIAEVEEEEEVALNLTEKGSFLGAPCEFTCSPNLHHVYCDPDTGACQCEKKFPVKLGLTTGCGKPKRLGETCFYREACTFSDKHSSCIQIHHNAICQCTDGYHAVTVNKPKPRIYCVQDLEILQTDFSALAGVAGGITVLGGLICFALKLFNQKRYPLPRHYGDAHFGPPICYSSEADTLTQPINGRRSASRSSQRTLNSIQSRRPSSSQICKGVQVSASRAGAARAAAILLISCHATATETPPEVDSRPGSRRPSLTSIHSSSSTRSYGSRRLERELEQKEEREMHLRLAKMHAGSSNGSGVFLQQPPTPSPLSTDELLPVLFEDVQIPMDIPEESSTCFHNDVPSTSKSQL